MKQFLNRYALAFSLTFIAGFINILGFIELGDVFVSFMSGNSSRLAYHSIMGPSSQIMKYISVLFAFVFGSFLGNLIDDRHAFQQREKILKLVFAMLAIATALIFFKQSLLGHVFIIIGMGAVNTLQLSLNDSMVGKTFMTGVLYYLGASLAHVVKGRKEMITVYTTCGAWLVFILGGILSTVLRLYVSEIICLLFVLFVLFIVILGHHIYHNTQTVSQ